ncbi:Uncharacterised protein [Mycobacteroides abscessus]|nr:Uncharacterised protein [Mycobacteroides abscessus]
MLLAPVGDAQRPPHVEHDGRAVARERRGEAARVDEHPVAPREVVCHATTSADAVP